MNLALPPLVDTIIRELQAAGHHAVVVGGAVRDALLGLKPKDFDIEVYGIAYDKLADILSRHGHIDLVGKSFGVVKMSGEDGAVYDFAIPRRDSKTGLHHRDFRATFDPSITPREAAGRRDFTINAIAFDPVSGDILDFFGGCEDLSSRTLRATSAAFSEDPLRVLRGLQLACRFDLAIEPKTAEMCREIADQYHTIARERIAEEFMKWAAKSSRPGRIFEYLERTGWGVHFAEIHRLAGVPQDPEWHPEGDVDIHTGLVVDAAARVADREGLEGDARAVLVFSALCHDFAKATNTVKRERGGRMRWSAYGHEVDGGPMARRFLERIGIKASIVDQVVKLVESHMVTTSMGESPTPRAVRRLAVRLQPASVAQLVRLIEADYSGRPPLPVGVPEGAARLKALAESQDVVDGPQPPLILGRHVLPYFDNRPGKHIGEVTAAAYEAQADGEFSTEAEALRWLDQHMSAQGTNAYRDRQ
jgi:tRNA nucleotidyltransferase (CCA-adding enzyme)